MMPSAQTHKNILFKILKDIYSDTSISPFLGFKGGTAAYVFYNLPRFSIDLDFDLLDESKEDHVFLSVKNIVAQYGKVKEAVKKISNLLFVISYQGKARNIKVEINLKKFDSKYEIKTHLGVSMLVMDKEDMFANKLLAMRDRMNKMSRDIYDVWFFANNDWPVNKAMVEKRSGKNYAEFLKECVSSLEKIENSRILFGIGELLDDKQKRWAKEKLKSDALFLLRVMLDNEKNS